MKTRETVCGYPLFRSRRLTVGISVKPGGIVEVRAPKGMAFDRIQAFVQSKAGWIAKAVAKSPQKPPLPDEEEQARLRALAQAVIPPLVETWASRMGVSPRRVRQQQGESVLFPVFDALPHGIGGVCGGA